MGPGNQSCSGSENLITFDLQYLICYIRFGYNPVQSNGAIPCGYVDEGAQTSGTGEDGFTTCTADAPCDITYDPCPTCGFFGCSDFDVTETVFGFYGESDNKEAFNGGSPMDCPYLGLTGITSGEVQNI